MILGLYRAAQYGELFATSELRENRLGVFSPKQATAWSANINEGNLRSPEGGGLSPLALTSVPNFTNKMLIFKQRPGNGKVRPIKGTSSSVYSTRYRFTLELLANPYGNSNFERSYLFGLARQVAPKVARLGLLGRYVKEVANRTNSSTEEYAVRQAVPTLLNKICQRRVVTSQNQYFRTNRPQTTGS